MYTVDAQGQIMATATSFDALITKIVEDFEKRDDELSKPYSVYNPSFVRKQDNNNIPNMTPESKQFMWYQIFTISLTHMNRPEKPEFIENYNQEMIKTCETYFTKTLFKDKQIDECSNEYSSDLAIHWYTKDSFLNRLLNEALRTMNVEILFLFRYVIQDIYVQLKKLYGEQRQNNKHMTTLTVYRGQMMTENAFIQIQRSIGEYVAANSFLSTSLKRNIALAYASSSSVKNDHFQSVLFEINITSDIAYRPYANISQFEDENEILLCIGTIFRVIKVDYDKNEHIYVVQLEVIDETKEPELKEISDSVKSEINQENHLTSLGNILDEMGQHDKAKYYFRYTLNKSLNDSRYILASSHKSLGNIARKETYLNLALEHYSKALEFYQSALNQHEIDISFCNNNIGFCYLEKGECEKAMEIYKKDYCTKCDGHHAEQVKCSSKFSFLNHDTKSPSLDRDSATFLWYQLLTKILVEISTSQYLSHNDEKDMQWYSQSPFRYLSMNKAIKTRSIVNLLDFRPYILDLQKKMSTFEGKVYRGAKISNDELTKLSSNIGGLMILNSFLSTSKDKDAALNFALSDLNPPLHPVLYEIHCNPNVETKAFISITNDEILFDISTVFKIIRIDNTCPPFKIIYLQTTDEHLQLINEYYDLAKKQLIVSTPKLLFARLMYYLGDYKIAYTFLKQFHENIDDDNENLATFYYDIAYKYYSNEEYDEALDTYDSFLKYTHNELLISQTMKYIGSIYEENNNYTKAIEYFQKVLENKTLRSNLPLVVNLYSNIGIIYQKINNYNLALEYYNRALDIQLENNDELQIASLYDKIGTVYEQTGEYTLTLMFYEKSLELKLKHGHSSIAVTYENLAYLYRSQEQYEMALKYYLQALYIQKQNLPTNHPYIEQIIREIGELYREKFPHYSPMKSKTKWGKSINNLCII
ncbi:unnamed protein product [Didymodactylos carnosus]|uniref:NAD(P)(+)--arginine ADP-ribosyltransferase n=1 Tax=Didymodactylos carnosus TaxID=1234261 RepID=A0A815EKA2_9BILA|nr:unnamed protein product [Didymodactylos carnosus]CAF4153540.1 unnamed protein product [Didymodactylos carnosus]